MCQSKPGPRCTAHARESLDLANDQLAKAEKRLDEYIRIYSANDLEDKFVSTRDDLRKKVADAKETVTRLTASWHETPGGFKELDQEYQKAVAERRMGDAQAIKEEFLRGKAARDRATFLYAAAETQKDIERKVDDVIVGSGLNGKYVERVTRGEVGSQRNVVRIGALSSVSAARMRQMLDAKGLQGVDVESDRAEDRNAVLEPAASTNEFSFWDGESD